MFLLPHHDGSELYLPDQTPSLGDTVRVRLRVPLTGYGRVLRVYVRSLRDGEPHYDDASRVPHDVAASSGWEWWEACVSLVNPVTRYRFLLEISGNAGSEWHWLNAEGLFGRDTPDVHDFRAVCHEPAPVWARRGVIYQVFPDRFARSASGAASAAQRATPEWAVECTWDTPVSFEGPDAPRQFYGGDLDGITERLDHIRSLGATVVYLTPFFPARSNHRYDAATFSCVDPLLGGDEALIRLVDAAHARGMRVIGDLTTNHTGDAHEWFQSALADPSSSSADFYYFSADHAIYASWYGVPSLPKLNWTSAGLRERFTAVIAQWLQPPFNLDGWRIDVANMSGRHGAVDVNRAVALQVRETMRRVKPDSLLLAESTNDAAADFDGDTWHGAMTYSNFTRPLWQWLARDDARVNFFGTPLAGPNRIPAEQFVELHSVFAAAFPWQVRTQNMIALNTHDTARAATVMIPGGLLIGLGIMFTMPGIPTLFAGDEFGLEGVNGEDSRAPLPWDRLEDRHHELRDAVAHLGRLRLKVAALPDGGFRWLYAEGHVLIYVREHASGSVLVVAARAGFEVELSGHLVCCSTDGVPELWGSGDVTADWSADAVRFRSGGPGVRLWALPGVSV
ncbi:alpha-glucosidase [Arthrobacter pigmenti]|uniref:Alpha-glucosidase n=1 Tax=Arthrobacter pigmenti TaxID=271432 RepID=A0A846RX63_9MICC|nr:glycoside hydrolase family 13 protein [Arthrobacter pigmenti]NJC23596.1 alpha-glucosidase [Arthrobacter pigmenti]